MLAELFHADRQTDMTKLMVASRNFANAPKNGGGTNEVCNTALGTRNNGPPKAGTEDWKHVRETG